MHQHHQLDISVSAKGGLEVKVHYRDQVPDLLARFSDEVRARAMRFVFWKTRYERLLLRACRDMPDWAKATVRQHILHERAVRIEANLARYAEARRVKAERQAVKLEARRKVEMPKTISEQRPIEVQDEPVKAAEQPSHEAVPLASPPHPEIAEAIPRSEEPHPNQTWGAPMKELPKLSLTERFARQSGALSAVPRPSPKRDRGR